MNTEQSRCIINLSSSLDTLNHEYQTESELVAFDKIKRVIIDLCQLDLTDHDNIEIYEFKGELFQKVAN